MSNKKSFSLLIEGSIKTLIKTFLKQGDYSPSAALGDGSDGEP